MASVVECWSIPSIDTLDLYPQSIPSINTLDQHLGWYSINTWSTVSQESTNFCRHAINCWPSANQVLLGGIDRHSLTDAFSTHDPTDLHNKLVPTPLFFVMYCTCITVWMNRRISLDLVLCMTVYMYFIGKRTSGSTDTCQRCVNCHWLGSDSWRKGMCVTCVFLISLWF